MYNYKTLNIKTWKWKEFFKILCSIGENLSFDVILYIHIYPVHIHVCIIFLYIYVQMQIKIYSIYVCVVVFL